MVFTAAALAAALAGATWSLARSPGGWPPGGPVAIEPSGCGTPAASLPAGPLDFTVTDTSPTAYAAVYLTDPGGGEVYGEIPWITPRGTQPLRTTLRAGHYALRCVWSDGTVRVSRTLSVTGRTTTATAAGYRPMPDLAMTAPVSAYRAWLSGALPRLLADSRTLDADVARGDLRGARSDWLAAHLDYERLGAAYNSFGDFDAEIDGLPDGLPDGVHSTDWTGLYAIEYGLWHGLPAGGPHGLRQLTRGLVHDVSGLIADFPSEEVDPGDLPLRAHEILENALQFQLTGDADFGSGSTLATLDANLQGTAEVVRVLRPVLAPRDPALLPRVDAEIRQATADVTACRDGAGRWTPLGTLAASRRRLLDADIDTLLEDLSTLPGLLTPRTSA